jgi:hypothetical protein
MFHQELELPVALCALKKIPPIINIYWSKSEALKNTTQKKLFLHRTRMTVQTLGQEPESVFHCFTCKPLFVIFIASYKPSLVI